MPDPTSDILDTLARVPLFADLNKRQLASIAKLARRVVHKPGHQVAAEGRLGLAFHVITDGDATVSVDGRVRRSLYPGDYFGEISMIDGQPRSATVTTGERGLTSYAVTRTHFLSIVESERAIARAVMIALCGRIRAAESAL